MASLERNYAVGFGRRAMFVLAGVIVLIGSAANLSAVVAAPEATTSKTDLKTVIIPVEGMICISCAGTVKKALKSLSGVSRVEVDLEKRTAQVTYASDQVSADRMVAVVNKLGYKAGVPRDAE
jgi:copper chaperone CopZ